MRTAEAILVVPNPYHHGIDFKNPFTMSKRGARRPRYPPEGGTGVFIKLDFVGSFPSRRAPSVAAKLRLMARFAALTALGRMRCSVAAASFFLRIGGAYRDRTDDLMLAKQPLSQLS